MTFIDAVSNRSRITCIMVVAKSDWMRIQNLPNRIGCGVKKIESAHFCCLVVLCCILGSSFPYFHRGRPETFTEGLSGHNILIPYRGLL